MLTVFHETITTQVAQNTTGNSGVIVAPTLAMGAFFVLDITAKTGTLTLDVKVQAYDQTSGKFVDLPGAAFAQQTGTGTLMLQVFPGIAASANVAVSSALPPKFRVVWTIGGSTPTVTFTIGCTYVE